MELSSLTNVTPSSTRSANGKSSASMDTGSAPFADVMQRAAVSESSQRSDAGGERPAPRTSNSSETQQPSTEESPSALATTRQAARDAKAPETEPEDSSQTATDTDRILKALQAGDMSGLHAVLASLSEKIDTGKADDTQLSSAQDDASDSLEGENLAAIIAALPLALASQPLQTGSGTTANNAAATANAGQAAMQQMALTVTDAARSTSATSAEELASIARAVLAEDGDHSDASVSTKASSSEQGLGGLLSAIDVNRSGNASGSGLSTAAGQVPPAGHSSTPDLLNDALSAADTERGGLETGPLSSNRSDAGSLASLSSSLSNALGSSPTAATAATATNGAIATSVHSPQWPASFGQQVLQMHQRGDQQMSLRLHPQDLGPLSVSLTVQDQQAQLQILSAHAPVRAAVEAAIPQLRQALADSGIALGEAMVGDQGQFQQGQSPSDDQPRRAPGASGSLLAASGIDTSDETTLRQVAIAGNGNINLYA